MLNSTGTKPPPSSRRRTTSVGPVGCSIVPGGGVAVGLGEPDGLGEPEGVPAWEQAAIVRRTTGSRAKRRFGMGFRTPGAAVEFPRQFWSRGLRD
jgi:hypothetical protein